MKHVLFYFSRHISELVLLPVTGFFKYLIFFLWLPFTSKLIGPVGREFANDLRDLGSIPGRIIPKTLKW